MNNKLSDSQPSNTRSTDDMIYEGKAKKIFRLTGADEGLIRHEFKDSATAFNGIKKDTIEGKGKINARVAAHLFAYLADHHIKSHFVRFEEPNVLVTKTLKMIPVEVVVRNRLAGSLAKKLQEKEGAPLQPPIVEWYWKDDEKQDPQVTDDLLVSYFKIPQEDLDVMKRIGLQINELLIKKFDQAGIDLIDFKLEFGKDEHETIILGDEISGDTCRLWDQKTGEKLDKDRFRFDLGDLMEGYKRIWAGLEGTKK